MKISDLTKKYNSKISPLDLEILISFIIKKAREFILANPEYTLTKVQVEKIKSLVERRANKEPVAYIIGRKGFYGLDFEVNKHTLIPRPETELIVDLLTNMLRNKVSSKVLIVDIGTGSGNIIISVSKNDTSKNTKYFGTDISKKALEIAKKNAKKHNVEDKIKLLHGNLLSPLAQNLKFQISSFKSNSNNKSLNKKTNLIITANLPYLSDKIYSSSPEDVRKYEPKTALYSDNHGLAHYENLLSQIKSLTDENKIEIIAFMEISPEQKEKLKKVIKKYFPESKIKFHKDLAKKWRICEIRI